MCNTVRHIRHSYFGALVQNKTKIAFALSFPLKLEIENWRPKKVVSYRLHTAKRNLCSPFAKCNSCSHSRKSYWVKFRFSYLLMRAFMWVGIFSFCFNTYTNIVFCQNDLCECYGVSIFADINHSSAVCMCRFTSLPAIYVCRDAAYYFVIEMSVKRTDNFGECMCVVSTGCFRTWFAGIQCIDTGGRVTYTLINK